MIWCCVVLTTDIDQSVQSRYPQNFLGSSVDNSVINLLRDGGTLKDVPETVEETYGESKDSK